MAKHLFSVFDVTRQVFFQSPLSIGIVNLKPLIPGHVLLIPRRVVPRLADLHPEEVSDLFLSVQRVGRVLEKAYDAEALTVSLQDGKSAGQSVPHVHIHLIPRRSTDFGGNNDKVYPALEEHEEKLERDMQVKASDNDHSSDVASRPTATEKPSRQDRWAVPKDEDRKARSEDVMEREAGWLKGLFEHA